MSVYFNFYVVEKRSDGKLYYRGLFTENGHIQAALSRPSSSIDSDSINYYSDVNLSALSDDLRKALFSSECDPDGLDPYTDYMKLIPMNKVISIGKTGGLKRGYIELETLDIITRHNYDTEIIEDNICDLASPEFVAELSNEDRAKYGHIAYIDYKSIEYIFSFISEYVFEYIWSSDDSYDNIFVLCVV